MTFLDARIDPRITLGAQGGPTVPGRSKVYTRTGFLAQSFTATMPIHRYDINYNPLSKADFQAVLDIWYPVMFTPYEGFRYKDWRDFQATQANSSLVFITGTTWQLGRKYTFGGATFFRPIQKPCSSPAAVIYRTRSSVVTIATATVDYTTGIATISGHAGGDTYTWAGEFDVPVTFTDDDWTTTLRGNTDEMYVQSGPLKLEEIRLR